MQVQLVPSVEWECFIQVPGSGLPEKIASGRVVGDATKAEILAAVEGFREALRIWHRKPMKLKNGKPAGMVWFDMRACYRNEKGDMNV